MKTGENEALRSTGLFVCKDAHGSAEIFNLARRKPFYIIINDLHKKKEKRCRGIWQRLCFIGVRDND